MGFEQWADVLRWVKANQVGNSQFTYYVSSTLHEKGQPVRVCCKAIFCTVSGKAEEQIHVSPWVHSNAQFDPFDASVDDLGCFRRGEHTSLPEHSSERSAMRFSLSTLHEPAEGTVYTCTKCMAGFCALPFQSHQLCKYCRPPTQMCMHGATNFERCVECKKMTGRDTPSMGLTRIVVVRRH